MNEFLTWEYAPYAGDNMCCAMGRFPDGRRFWVTYGVLSDMCAYEMAMWGKEMVEMMTPEIIEELHVPAEPIIS